jgi:hypothetical protein
LPCIAHAQRLSSQASAHRATASAWDVHQRPVPYCARTRGQTRVGRGGWKQLAGRSGSPRPSQKAQFLPPLHRRRRRHPRHRRAAGGTQLEPLHLSNTCPLSSSVPGCRWGPLPGTGKGGGMGRSTAPRCLQPSAHLLGQFK